MSQVFTFPPVLPPARFDDVPWSEARIEESATDEVTSGFSQIDVIAIDPVDADPSDPAVRMFTTALASDTADLWYRIVFADASSATFQPTQPVQNNLSAVRDSYSSVTELARVLKIRDPSDEQALALARVLAAAADEIDMEVGNGGSFASATWTPYSPPFPALAVEVNIERAVEHWAQGDIPFGIVGLGDTGATYTARDTWDRHAHKLSPLKQSWGLA